MSDVRKGVCVCDDCDVWIPKARYVQTLKSDPQEMSEPRRNGDTKQQTNMNTNAMRENEHDSNTTPKILVISRR